MFKKLNFKWDNLESTLFLKRFKLSVSTVSDDKLFHTLPTLNPIREEILVCIKNWIFFFQYPQGLWSGNRCINKGEID